MYLLVLIIGFVVGFWCCQMWGNHRAKYWQKKLRKVIVKADAVNAANTQLLKVAERVRKYERGDAADSMQIGLTEAMSSMNGEDTYA